VSMWTIATSDERRPWVTLFTFYSGAKKCTGSTFNRMMRWRCSQIHSSAKSLTSRGTLSFFRWQRFHPRRNFSTPRERFFGHVSTPSHTTAAFLYPTEAKVRIRRGAEVMVRRSKRSFQANIWSFVNSAYSRGLPIFPRSWPTIEPHR
jgi:hypothetical protein